VIGLLLRRPWRLPRLVLAVPAVLGFALGLVDRGALKSAVIRAALGGLSHATVQAWTGRYVSTVVPARLFPDALQAIAAHRAAGDWLVLMSASPDLFVPALGRGLGFDQILCTEVRWDEERLNGSLVTANRRGEEKVRCLEALRRAHPGSPVTGYGNSDPDIAHLRLCDAAVYVNARGALRNRLQSLGMRIVDWA